MTHHLVHDAPSTDVAGHGVDRRSPDLPGAARPGAVRSGAVRPVAYVLGLALAAVTVAASAPTFFVDGVLSGPAVMRGSARGTAIVLLVLGVPALLACMATARWGGALWARRAFLAWVGVTGYVLYNGVMFVLGTPFNSLFLLYEAVIGLGIASLLALLTGLDATALAAATDRAPYRAVGAWLGFVAVANSLVWLRMVVPALGDPAHAEFLQGTGLTVFPTHVQDFAFWLPLAAVAGVWLWQRRVWGYVLGAAITVYYLLEGVGVAVDQWMGSHADPASTIATMGGFWLFTALAVVGVLPAVAMLRHPGTSTR